MLAMALAVVMLLAGCGKSAPNPVPAAAKEYAVKHDIGCLDPNSLAERGIVGKKYVVYGEITNVFFLDYKRGSKTLNDFRDDLENQGFSASVRAKLVGDFADTIHYYIDLDDCTKLDVRYEAYSAKSNRLNINMGDRVAFLVLCEDGLDPGDYKYTIIEKIWEDRVSASTIEEDTAAKEKVAFWNDFAIQLDPVILTAATPGECGVSGVTLVVDGIVESLDAVQDTQLLKIAVANRALYVVATDDCFTAQAKFHGEYAGTWEDWSTMKNIKQGDAVRIYMVYMGYPEVVNVATGLFLYGYPLAAKVGD